LGIQQTPGLGSKNNDITKWNDENYKALKRVLSRFILLIRFLEIGSSDFFDKVLPFKTIIPNNIYKEVLEFYTKNTVPNKIPILPQRIWIRIESKIIKPRLAFIITNWIKTKRCKFYKNESLYNFDLIYQDNN